MLWRASLARTARHGAHRRIPRPRVTRLRAQPPGYGPVSARHSPQNTPNSGRPCDSLWSPVGNNAWPAVAFVGALKPTSRP